MSVCPTLIPEQCSNRIQKEDDKIEANVLCSVSSDDASADVTAHHTKSECLNLISKIWKNGLNHKLEQITNCNPPVQQTTEMETEAELYKKCSEVNSNDFAVSDSSCAIQVGFMQFEPGSQSEHNCLSTCNGEMATQHNKTCNMNHADKKLNSNEVLTFGSVSFSPSQIANPSLQGTDYVTSCHDCLKTSGQSNKEGPFELLREGESPTTDIPPFKKARYSWQVKNKIKSVHTEEQDMYTDHLSMWSDESPSTVLVQKAGEDVSMNTLDHSSLNNESNVKISVIKGKSTEHLAFSNDPQDVEVSDEMSPEVTTTSVGKEPAQGTGHQDFNKLTEALTQLTHTERWQCQHVAKAIVDNAINKTLEEMGLSPGSNSAIYHEQRSRIEDAGVSQAILSRGLRRYAPNDHCMHRLNPLIDRLTNMSEDMLSGHFSEHEGEPLSEQENPTVNGQLVTAEMMDIYFSLEGPLAGQTEQKSNKDVTSDTPPSPSLSLSVETNNSSAALPAPEQSENQTGNVLTGERHDCSGVACQDDPLPENKLIHHKQGITFEEIEKGPSSKYVLDQALNAVICERGLQCQELF